MARLDDAARRHAQAKTALAAAKRRARDLVNAAREKVEETREELAEAIVEETLAGARQVDLTARSGYSRESIRTIQRKAGIEPAE